MNAVKKQMREMKRNLSNERYVADERLMKKMCVDKGVQFKRKGNEKQHQFNELLSHSCPPAKYGVIVMHHACDVRMLLRRKGAHTQAQKI